MRELWLEGSKATDSGVKHLSSLLEDPNCKLERLDLESCSITDEGFRMLASALRSEPSALRDLWLGEIQPGPSAQQLLSELKKHPHCKHIQIHGELKKRQCKALFDHVPQDVDELELKVGDVVEITEEVEEGWWSGVLNGKFGLFPSNFVKEMEESDDADADNGNTEAELKKRQCKALFDFAPQYEDELELKVGDVVEIIEDVEEGWWSGVLNGKFGLFPSNCVKEMEESDDADADNGNTEAELKKRQCKALFDFAPQYEDELELKVGDVIEIIEDVEEGWWSGVLNGKFGLFPSNCVKEMEESDDADADNGNTEAVDEVFNPELPSVSHGSEVIREDSSESAVLDQENLDSVDNPDRRTDVRGLSEDMAELDISAGETQCMYDRRPNCCKSCEDVEDTSHWILMGPSVSMETGVPVYTHSSPPGSFECTVSGLRWVCVVEVSLQYHFSDPHVYGAELAMLQYEPIGPLMDIKVLSGELLEAHLPHFACLEGSDSSLREAVRVLHGVNSSVTLEKCELTRFHAKLLKPSFSLTQILVKIATLLKAHLEVRIYRTRVTPSLFTYVVPRDAFMIQAVKDDSSRFQDAEEIITHRPNIPIRRNTEFSLKASLCDAEIDPSEITLKYIAPPEFFKVVIENVGNHFYLELTSKGKTIWKAKFNSSEYGETGHGHGIPLEASRRDTSNKDRLSRIKPDLIERTSEGVLKGLLSRLESHQPPVLHSTEVQNILQKTSVLQDQVTSLINMVLNKGDKACGVMLCLLKELDGYLSEDLGL
ncbi:caspase recruitment domain-containing protein 8-like [Sardina pilchardus]|uniref:caspase recruitment domain-containing protein 8-like n=1 Tax=Sardina pilchardus TaxID=27697 RepID=UPI002E0F7186